MVVDSQGHVVFPGPFHEGVQHSEQGVRIDFQFCFSGGVLYEFVAVEGILVQVNRQADCLETVFRKNFYIVLAYLKGSVELAVFFKPVGEAHALVQVLHGFLLKVGVDIQFFQGDLRNHGVLGDDVGLVFFFRRFVVVGASVVGATTANQVNVVNEYGILGIWAFGLETHLVDVGCIEGFCCAPAFLLHFGKLHRNGGPFLACGNSFRIVVAVCDVRYFYMNIVGSAFVTVLDGIVFAVIIFRQTNAPSNIGIVFVSTFFQGVLDIE